MASLMNPYEGQIGQLTPGNTMLQNATAAMTFSDLMDARNKRKIEEGRAEKDYQENEQIKQIIPKYVDQMTGQVDIQGLIGEVGTRFPHKASAIADEFSKMQTSTIAGQRVGEARQLFDVQRPDLPIEDQQQYYGGWGDKGFAAMTKPEGVGKFAYSERKADIERIYAMPENTPEEKRLKSIEKEKFWSNVAPSSVYSTTPESILGAGQRAATTTGASGAAKADTPDFIADRQKEWQAEVKPFAEVMQNYALANSGASGAVADVALIKALEKVREPSSAVMFGDAEIWRKSGNFFDKALEGGILDAVKSGTTKTLPEAYRIELRKLLNNAYAVAEQKMKDKRASYIDVAKRDYKWGADRIDRVYTIPTAKSAGSVDGWTSEKEKRYQELLKKRGGK